MSKHKATSTPKKVKEQQENAARMEAERLTAPKPIEESVVKIDRPTLSDKLKAIDEEVANEVRAKKLRIAQEAARDARNNFQAWIDEDASDDVKSLWGAIKMADKAVRDFSDGIPVQENLFGTTEDASVDYSKMPAVYNALLSGEMLSSDIAMNFNIVKPGPAIKRWNSKHADKQISRKGPGARSIYFI